MRNQIVHDYLNIDQNNNQEYHDSFHLMMIFSREKMDAAIFEGRIDSSKCDMIFKQIVPLAADQEYLLCGPAPMIFSVRSWL